MITDLTEIKKRPWYRLYPQKSGTDGDFTFPEVSGFQASGIIGQVLSEYHRAYI